MNGATSVRDYFLEESRTCVGRVSALLAEDTVLGDPSRLLDEARGLRGTAQMARDTEVLRVARLLEGAAHALVDGSLTWSSDVRERIELTLGDIGVALARSEDDDALERRIDAAEQRWQALDVRPWTPAAMVIAEADVPAGLDDEAFLSFAAGEIDGILSVLRESLDALAGNGMDREAMTAVLRRQRALLGTARLDELTVVAETLRAIEDVSRIIARLNVAIKDEWLDVFRCARIVLESSAEPLARGENPPHTPALSRLRTYRQELVERYGSGDDPLAVAPPEQPAEPPLEPIEPAQPVGAPAATVHPAPEPASPPAESSSIDIQNLVYTGEAALRRALDLRARLEQAVEHDPDALALVDEVFDLIRLGLR